MDFPHNDRRERRARGASRILVVGLVFWILAILAFAAGEPSYVPPLFGGEILYYFREQLRGTKVGEKSFSAPSHEREALPLSRVALSEDSATRIVEGRVAHLPYRFLIKLVRKSSADLGKLEVNVVDRSGRPLQGFPQRMENPLTRTGDSTRKEFEIPTTQALTKKIEKTLLAKNQFLTHVELIVGMDDEFLSSGFPK
jgi:hypothetical protein